MANKKSIGTWLLVILVALPVGAAGIGKLMGVEMMHQSFQMMGMPEWFGYFIGSCEMAGALGLLIPRLSSTAAAGLLAIMLGAIGFHIAFTPLSTGVPALVLALLAGVIIFVRKPDSFWFPGVQA
ncbi:MAG: DoxX family protein [Bermanella sp.]